MRLRTAALLAFTAIAACLPAQAHHSQAMYDTKTWKQVEGTVREMRWTFPHTWLYLDVKDASGKVVTWGLEAANPNSVWAAGVKKEDIKPGDHVKARCHPVKTGSPSCVLGFVTPLHGDKARGDGVEKAWN